MRITNVEISNGISISNAEIATPTDVTWILENGVWNDNGVWVDNETWKDS